MKICKVDGCKNVVLANGVCSKHYSQLRKYGKIFKYSYRDKTNHIEIVDAEIFLIDKNNEICAKAIIDIEDIDKVKDIKWHRSDLQRSTYYCMSNNKKWRRLHRLILNIDDPKLVIDHINHNGLDNRKSNLRICTNSENICNQHLPKNNKSGHKGVYWCKEKHKQAAQITVNRKTIPLGRYKTLEEAIEVRNRKAKEIYGEFANEDCCKMDKCIASSTYMDTNN